MKDKDNKAFWQKIAFMYTSFMDKSKPLYEEIIKEISKETRSDMNVLELACGTGQLSFSLSEKVNIYEATDFSPKMIEEAKKKKAPSNLKFSVKDATCLPYADESFDAVIISNALHIMPEPQKALKEIKRVLKKDGILFAPTFIKGDSIAYKIRIAVIGAAGFKIFHKWTEDELLEFLKENGFETKKHISYMKEKLPLCYLECKILL